MMNKYFYENYLAFFPTLIFLIFLRFYYNGQIIELSNKNTVILLFILCIPFLNKSLIMLNKNLIPFYFFLITSFFSIFFLESDYLQNLSFKRFLIIFVPSFLILQSYSNCMDIENVFIKAKYLFITFVLFLCVYAILVFIFDFQYLTNIVQKNPFLINTIENTSHSVTNNILSLGQIYYTRHDLIPTSCQKNYCSVILYRPSSLLSNVIGFSQILLFSLILMLNNNLFKRRSYSIIIFLILLGTFLWTFSRINIVIFFLLIPFIYLLISKKYLISSLVYVPTLFFILIFNLNYFDYFIDLNSIKFIGNLYDRFEVYKLSQNYIKEYFFHGLGFGISSESLIASLKNQLTEHNKANEISLPSIPLIIFLETGIIGIISYTMILALPIIQNRNSLFYIDVNNKHLLILLISIYFTQFFDVSLFRFHPLTFLFCVILGIYINKIRKFNVK